MAFETEKEKLIENYKDYFQRYGDTPAGVQYGSEEGQVQRFEQLVKVGEMQGRRILDLGCGLGHMYPFLINKFGDIQYTGIDIVPDTIAHASQQYREAEFICRDIMSNPLNRSFDFVLMNGLFNNVMAGSREYMQTLLLAAYDCADVGLAFNFTSTYVNSIDETMAYHSPEQVMTFCLDNLSRIVTVHHHYSRCDVAIFVYRNQ